MKTAKTSFAILFMIIAIAALAGSASATLVNISAQSPTVNYGQNVTFDYYVYSMSTPTSYSIDLQYSNGTPIRNVFSSSISGSSIYTTFILRLSDYNNSGNYRLKLYAIDHLGYTDTNYAYFTVNNTVVNFTLNANQTSGQEPQTIAFTLTNLRGDAPFTYQWNFGDGSANSTTQNATHTYLQNGTYTARVTVRDANNDILTRNISINVADTVPAINFTWTPSTIYIGDIVNFTSIATTYDGVTNYSWNFGDGATSTTANASHTYNATGTKNVTLQVRDADGSTTSLTRALTVQNRPVNFTLSTNTTSGTEPLNVALYAINVTGDAPFTYQWNFGDASANATTQNATHTYSQNGTYTATLTVFDSNGDSLTRTTTMTVADTVPNVEFAWSPISPYIYDNTTFTSNTSAYDTITNYTWTIDGTAVATTQDMNTTFLTSGDHNITLSATDTDGSTTTTTHTITVQNRITNFTISANTTNGQEPLSVQFNTTIIDGDAPFTYQWNFGDSTTSSTANPSHTYLQNGTYSANLTVTDYNGDAVTRILTVTVTDTAPAVDFTWSPLAPFANDSIAFFGNATAYDGIISHSWSVDGTAVAATQDMNLTPLSTGDHNITLSATDADGSTTTTTYTITVQNRPVAADLLVSTTSGTEPLAVDAAILNVTGDAPFTYSIYFGEGTAAATQNASHTYLQNGTYTITATITDFNNDTINLTSTIIVGDSVPTSDFDWTPVSPFTNDTVQFSNNASAYDGIATYNWDFGDSTTSLVPNATHNYALPGEYNVTLTITDNDGSTTGTTHAITVQNTPVVFNTIIEPTSGTEPLFVAFNITNETGDQPIAYFWDFGDGATSTNANDTHTYMQNGTYEVIVTLTDANNDSQSQAVNITVADTVPSVEFTWSPISPYIYDNTTFTSNTSAYDTITNYTWTIDGTAVTTTQDMNTTFLTSGDHNITLSATDADGSTTTTTHTITVQNRITNFTISANTTNGQEPQTITFETTITDGDAPFTYQWNFGDGSSNETTQNATHTYAQNGTYTATLTVTDLNGDELTQTITITITDTAPIVDFDWMPAINHINDIIAFTSNASAYDGITGYQWDFGDNSSLDTTADANHSYLVTGDYQVTLSVTDADGSITSVSKNITIVNKPVIFNISATPTLGSEALAVDFNISDADGDLPLNYSWDFGDGSSVEYSQNASHTYLQNGTYTAIATVSDSNGDIVSENITITVTDTLPIANFTAVSATPFIYDDVNFTDLSSAYDGITSWSWDFGDASANATTQNTTHSYAMNGTYTVTLTVTDSDGSVASATTDINVQNRMVAFDTASNTTSGTEPLAVAFIVENETGDLPLSYSWDFGDGATSTNANDTHTYLQNGTYDANITVTDMNGDALTRIITVTVGDTMPVADFDWSPTIPFIYDNVTFASNSTAYDTIVDYEWTIDGILSSNIQSFTRTFNSSGDHNITLQVTDSDGSTATISKTLTVQNRITNFTISANTTNGQEPQTITFQTTITDGDEPFTYQWNFGDGSANETTQNATHTYAQNGTYTATLTVTDLNGDELTQATAITITDTVPSVEFTWSPTSPFIYDNTTFTSNTSAYDTITNYTWTIDGTAVATTQDMNTAFLTSGDHNITLSTTDADGSTTTTTHTITVQNRITNFTISSDTVKGDEPLTVNFNSTVTDGDAPFAYLWDFGDGTTSTNANDSHTYVQNGTYNVNLTVTDLNGDSLTQTISIEAVDTVPVADFNWTPATIYMNDLVTITSNSSAYDGISAYNWSIDGVFVNTTQSIITSFPAVGDYTIDLTVTDSDGSETTISKTISVINKEVAFDINVNPQSGSEPLNITGDITNEDGDLPLSYFWDFGDGTNSTLANVTHTYLQNGSYTITTVVSDANGDNQTQLTTITVGDTAPIVDFNWSPTSPLIAESVQFNADATAYDGIASWSWDFGDASANATTQNATHSYAMNGTYTVTLTVTDSDGSITSNTHAVTVQNTPVDFTISANTTSGSEALDVAFNTANISGDSPFTYQWDFADASANATTQNATHTYLQNGKYTATLTITDMNGDATTRSIAITVADTVPNVEFTWSPTSPFIYDNTTFTSNTSAYDTITNYTWTIDGTAVATTQDMNTTFLTSGDHNITLSATDADGSTTTTTHTITVQNRITNFTINANTTNGQEPQTITFETTITDGDAPFTYQWNFGDDSANTTTQNATHTYAQNGTYTTTLTVTDLNGDELTQTITITITDTLPVANFSWSPSSPQINETTVFTDTSASYDPIANWYWSIDGIPSGVSQNLTARFNSSGDHTVTLTIEDINGDVDTISNTVTVQNLNITATAVANVTSGTEPLNVAFSAINVSGDLPISYQWNFGDGSANATTQNATHTYTQNGTYTATLTAIDYNGDSYTQTIGITVADTVPSAEFTWAPTTIYIGDQVSFTSNVSAYDGISNYYWTVDVPTVAITPNMSYTFNAAGSYDIALNVTDNDGSVTSVMHQITVLNRPVNFTIAANTTAGPEPQTVQFTSTIIDGDAPFTYSWDFADGNTSSLANATNTYLQNGTYNATLTVTDFNGDNNTQSIVITIADTVPVVNFNWTPSPVYQDEIISFEGSATSYDGISAWNWTINGINAGTTQNITRNFTTLGAYTVVARATDSDGSTASRTRIVNVVARQLNYTLESNATTGTEPLDVQFDITNLTGDAPFTYRWDFADGTTSTSAGPVVHTYTQNGTYSMNVTVTDAHNNNMTQYMTITVNDAVPIVDFSWNPANPYVNDNVSFTSIVSSYDPIATYSWMINGSNVAATQNMSAIFAAPSTYAITLIVTDADGSSANATHTITVPNIPVNFTASANTTNGTEPADVSFTVDSVTGDVPIAYFWNFGDGANSTLANVTHTYSQNGTYTASITITDSTNEVATRTFTITIGDTVPSVDFTWSPATPYINDVVELNGTGTAYDGISGWQWLVDGTLVAAGQYNSTAFLTSGSHNITVIATDADGSSANMTHEITVLNRVTDFALAENTTSGSEPLTVGFDVTITDGDSPFTYSWNFADGTTSSVAGNVSHTYMQNGTYNATITITDVNGDATTRSTIITVSDTTPTSEFNWSPASPYNDETVQFTTNASAYDGISNYNWDFGDNTTSTVANATHLYQMPGDYNITLSVTDGDGSTASATQQITVLNRIVGFTLFANTTAGVEPSSVAFTIDNITGDSPFAYSWNFGDGAASTSASNLSHNYAQNGTYEMNLTITDINNDSLTQSLTITVNDTVPAVDFTLPATAYIGENVVFNDNSTSYDPITAWSWEIEGSPAGNMSSLTASFNATGTYNILLGVHDSDGSINSTTKQITIINMVPAANISIIPSSGFEPLTIQANVTAASGDAPLSYLWDFGDGATSTNANDTHTYTQNGTYLVSMTLTDGNADNITYNSTVIVDDTYPTVNFTWSPAMPVVGSQVDFTPSASAYDTPITYHWDFGDGITSIAAAPSHTYQSNGSFDVNLTATDADGSRATAIRTILVGVPDLTAPAIAINSPLAQLYNTTTVLVDITCTDAALDSTWYNFDNGSNQTYAGIINETVSDNSTHTLYAYCNDTSANNASATIAFIINTSAVMDNNVSFALAANATIGTEPIDTAFTIIGLTGDAPFIYTWDFGDGNITNGTASATHAYVQNGTYTVTLNLTDSDGDSYEDSVTITIADTVPAVEFYWNASTIYENDSVAFFGNASAYDGIGSHSWLVNGTQVAATENATLQFLAGDYNITYVATDSDGSIASATHIITALLNYTPDVTAPNITINSPAAGTYNTSSITVDITCVDDIAVDTIWFNFDNGTNTYNTSNISMLSGILSDGDHVIYAYCNDTSANNASATAAFTINTSTPVAYNIFDSWINNVQFVMNTSIQVFSAIGINITQSSTINSSNITNAPSDIIDSYLLYSTLVDVSPIINCTAIGTPTVYNYLEGISCVNQYIDPSTIIGSNISGTTPIVNSTILYSNVTNSNSVNSSQIINSSAENITIVGSVLNESIANDSEITNSTIENGSQVIGSEITGTNVTDAIIDSSNITASDVMNCEMQDSNANASVIANCNMTGTVVQNSTVIDVNSTNSTLTDATATNSTISQSNATNATIDSSELNASSIVNSSIANSTIEGSELNGTSVILSNVTNSTIANTTLDDATLNNTEITGSTITNTTANDANITGSTLNDTTVSNSNVTGSNTTGANITGSFVNSTQVTNSTLDNSTVSGGEVTGSQLNDTIATNTTLVNVNISDSNITGSTLNGTIVSNTTLNDVNVTGGNVSDSTLDNVTLIDSNVSNANLTNTVVQNTTLGNITIIDGNVTDGVLQNGSVVIDANGNNITINGTANVTDYFNHAPVANGYSSTTSTTPNTLIDFIDSSSDADIGGALNDSIAYYWDFGDGANSTLANNSHSYTADGTYTVVHTVTDGFGESSSITFTITIASASSGGRGGGGGGGGYMPPRNCTANYTCAEWSACTANSQNRTCVDRNRCSVNATRIETRSCGTSSGTASNATNAGGSGSGSTSGTATNASGLASMNNATSNATGNMTSAANETGTAGKVAALGYALLGNATKPSNMGLILLAVIIIAYIIYRLIKKRKQDNPKAKKPKKKK